MNVHQQGQSNMHSRGLESQQCTAVQNLVIDNTVDMQQTLPAALYQSRANAAVNLLLIAAEWELLPASRLCSTHAHSAKHSTWSITCCVSSTLVSSIKFSQLLLHLPREFDPCADSCNDRMCTHLQ
jgi:hypothetical protein